jgi:hypothetical protein
MKEDMLTTWITENEFVQSIKSDTSNVPSEKKWMLDRLIEENISYFLVYHPEEAKQLEKDGKVINYLSPSAVQQIKEIIFKPFKVS